jgi:hypothetical protein
MTTLAPPGENKAPVPKLQIRLPKTKMGCDPKIATH